MSNLCVNFQPSSTPPSDRFGQGFLLSNSKCSLLKFPLLIDFVGGSCSCCCCSSSSSCDRGKTKSTPSLIRLRLEFDNNTLKIHNHCSELKQNKVNIGSVQVLHKHVSLTSYIILECALTLLNYLYFDQINLAVKQKYCPVSI